MVFKIFYKRTSCSGIKNENISNQHPVYLAMQKLAEELHKSIIRKLEKRKVQSPFIDNSLGANLADMQLISKFNKGIRFLLCVIDIFNKQVWVIPLNDKKRHNNCYAFPKNVDKSNRKPNKIWEVKGKKCYNRSMESRPEKNSAEMYSIHNKRKSVIAERLI